MGIELEWVKKLAAKTARLIYRSFLFCFNSSIKFTIHYKSSLSALSESKESVSPFSILKVENVDVNWRIKNVLEERSLKKFSLGKKKEIFLKSLFLVEGKKIISGTFKAFLTTFYSFLTFSLSLHKHRYPQNWKTIFVHLLEKSNLSVRSDHNTGFSLRKVLQTTTI